MDGWDPTEVDEVVEGLDASHARVCGEQRGFFKLLLEAERLQVWEDWGARDLPHWVAMRYGISEWKARRWVAAAHALEDLPRLSEAFASGELSVDKVVELTRFATPEDEGRLIAWARGVSTAAVRHRGDVAARPSIQEAREAEDARSLHWWYHEDGRRFGLAADLPAADGAVVARAIERLAQGVPTMPGEEHPVFAEARRADALVALCSSSIACDPDPDRATVVVHASVEALERGDRGCELEVGGVIHPETARRLACTARIQGILEDSGGNPVRVGRLRRDPPGWMLRHLRYRDRECRFPGCGARRFLQAHHIRWWEHGGTTELWNLLFICFFHHKLVHEHGWRMRRETDGTFSWFRPDETRYRAGPGPPREDVEPQPALAAAY